jgi:hypothetical protein
MMALFGDGEEEVGPSWRKQVTGSVSLGIHPAPSYNSLSLIPVYREMNCLCHMSQ